MLASSLNEGAERMSWPFHRHPRYTAGQWLAGLRGLRRPSSPSWLCLLLGCRSNEASKSIVKADWAFSRWPARAAFDQAVNDGVVTVRAANPSSTPRSKHTAVQCWPVWPHFSCQFAPRGRFLPVEATRLYSLGRAHEPPGLSSLVSDTGRLSCSGRNMTPEN